MKWPWQRKPVPEITKIEFPDTTIYAHCWCPGCDWTLNPTGWYDSDGPILLGDLVALWQDVHDMEGTCRVAIGWKELS